MATQGETAGLSEKALEVAERVFHKIWDINDTPDLWHWLVLIVASIIILIFLFTMMIKALGVLIDKIVTFIEIYKKNGFPVWLNKKNKIIVRRRKQFCSVLDADLSYLAKAENWNDQYFTDLEAEVETEGGYYASTIDKLRKKKSFGLRKERSLIRALKFSSERAMQLVGEPGSGKSVALRHLAKQLAEQGEKSSDKNAIVPLYINLREMEFGDISEVSVDSVRQFILDNIRRGDADTSSFVKENWEDYCNRGVWLFLFDSFDEIPDVLHSATGSDVIRVYSRAIGQFLEGMGECKGILASREFKGPEALPWTKLRILPLSGEKQDELIRNSFLSEDNMSLVNQHLINPHSSIGTTPLFLTLLCRYVRDEGQTPRNDHDILLQHIERLAKREPEYLQRKYNLNPEDLLIGAERLAQLLAEERSISLAPTLTQIKNKLALDEIPGGSIENLISALVDSKIGRTDVPNAVQGDRRFAFAHRRYQEALFVRYLTKYPETISATELLMESRWREYTVTLLQTGTVDDIRDLLISASAILEQRAKQQCYCLCEQSPLLTDSVYYDWSSEIAIPILSLLQEGLAHRLKDVPEYLSSAVSKFLTPRWITGDGWDRCTVLYLGGLLPQETLIGYIVDAFSCGTKLEQLNAFKQTVFASKLPENVQKIVLEMLSDQTILAQDRAEEITAEALAARLPVNMGAGIVVSRGKRIRRRLKVLNNIFHILNVGERIIQKILGNKYKKIEIFNVALVSLDSYRLYRNICLLFSFLISAVLFITLLYFEKRQEVPIGVIFALSISFILFSIVFGPFVVRSHGRKYNAITIFLSVLRSGKLLSFIKIIITGVFVLSITSLIGFILGHLILLIDNNYILNVLGVNVSDKSVLSKVFSGFPIILFIFCMLGSINLLISYFKNKKRNRKNIDRLNFMKEQNFSELNLLYSAQCYEQLVSWLRYDRSLLKEQHSARAFSCFVLNSVRLIQLSDDKTLSAIPDCLKGNEIELKIEGFYSKSESLRQIIENRVVNCMS